MAAARLTVTLPPGLVAAIDRRDRNRSRFVLDAVRREIHHRRRDELRRSLERPHSESAQFADASLTEWDTRANEPDSDLLDLSTGKSIHWVAGRGWRLG